MIPSINDLTSHWKFNEFPEFETYTGTLFGKNILVYNGKYVDLTQLLNDNSRIQNSIQINGCIYVLLGNNNLYEIIIVDHVIHKLFCTNIKGIFVYDKCIHMLDNNGKIFDRNLTVSHENISVIPKIPQFDSDYIYVFICNKENNIINFNYKFNKLLDGTNTNTVVDICVMFNNVYILYDNNSIVICDICGKNITTKIFNNINSIVPISSDKIGIIFDDNNIVVNYIIYNGGFAYDTINHNHETYKAISIPNSPYCANFNTETIPYYPKYFMDRFIAFVMSVKYGHNIKLPKYLYFMIANNLK